MATFLRAACAVLLLMISSCDEKGGEAVVLSKEYIPAPPKDETVKEEGTPPSERWRILVEMRSDLRKVQVLVDHAAWDKLKAGDRVNVRYSQGKYTGTIWSSELK